MNKDAFIEALKQYLTPYIQEKEITDNEDFNAYEYSGGNYDAVFELGVRHGSSLLAKQLKATLDSIG